MLSVVHPALRALQTSRALGPGGPGSVMWEVRRPNEESCDVAAVGRSCVFVDSLFPLIRRSALMPSEQGEHDRPPVPTHS